MPGHTPHIRSEGYGHWAAEVLKGLGIQKGIRCRMLIWINRLRKALAIVAPEMVDKVIMLNPRPAVILSIVHWPLA